MSLHQLSQWTTDPSQPVSQGTRTIAGAISQSIAATDWQDQWQTASTESASQLADSIEQGQQPSNPLQVSSQPFDSQSITQAMSQAASSSQLIGGQLIVASDNSDLSSSLRQAESQIMASATDQPWSGDGTSQAATNSVDLGLDAQAVHLNDQQLSQAVDGSLLVGLFGLPSTQMDLDPGGVANQSSMMAEGEEGSSGSGDSSQDDPTPIPHVDFPQLRFAQGGVSPDNFIPTGLSSFTDTRGSMGPFAGGSNWVHTGTVGWVSEQTWTYTETLIMRFLVGDVTSDGGPLEDSTPEDTEEDTEDEEPVDDRLQTQGTWSSMAGSLRGGYVQLTFNAARGSTSATANSSWFNIIGAGSDV